MLKAYYNEIDPYCCAWIRNLMRAGCVTDVVVDERSIIDVKPGDLVGFDRVHFFSGIALWDYALNLAMWSDEQVWTGSAPCQPWSGAGKGLGFADSRHLWPVWFRLIAKCRPERVCGEQVAGPAGDLWFDAVQADLEGCGYAVGQIVLPSASVGAPNIRHRRYWFADRRLADATGERERSGLARRDSGGGVFLAGAGTRRDSGDDGAHGGLANTCGDRRD